MEETVHQVLNGDRSQTMKMAVFWVVAPCSLKKFTDVSEVLAAAVPAYIYIPV
jgi:hypothetical protein